MPAIKTKEVKMRVFCFCMFLILGLSEPVFSEQKVVESSQLYGRTEGVVDSIQQTDPNCKFKSGYTSLHYAAARGDTEAVRSLLSEGADPNIQNDFKSTALHLAVSNGHTETAELLVSAGTDINIQNRNGDTVLHLALLRKLDSENMEFVKLLLSSGADPNIPFGDAISILGNPLYFATIEGNTKLVKLFLSADAKPDTQIWGETALHRAVIEGHIDIVNLLLSANVDIERKLRDHSNAFDLAIKYGHNDIALLLAEQTENSFKKQWRLWLVK